MRDEIPGVGRRVIAVLIDFVMLFLAKIPIDQALSEITPSPTLLTLISYGIAIVYSTVFLGSRGQTPGKTMASLRVISVDGSGLNQRQALVRSVLKWSPIYAPLFLIAVTLPIPMTLQDATVGSPIPPPDPHPVVAMIPFVAFAVLGYLAIATRRHPDGRAPHDRVTDTSVIKVQ